MGLKLPRSVTVLKWVYCVLIGVATGAVSFLVGLTVSNVYGFRSRLIFKFLERPSFFARLVLWAAFNLTFAVIGCVVTLALAVTAAGSGIPEVKAYLNGAPAPGYFTWQNFVAKVVGSACGVSSGMAVGKEGPCVHIGSIIASIISDTRILKDMQESDEDRHEDRDRRDFVTCGAAAGFAACFGAPLAGVFFGLEVATTRWRAELTWRALLTCATSVWTEQLMHTVCDRWRHVCGDFEHIGLFHVGTDLETPWSQIVPIALMGVLGGLCGALFTKASIKLQKFRQRFHMYPLVRLAEVVAVCSTYSTASFLLLLVGTCKSCDWVEPDCSPASEALKDLRIKCPAAHYNDMTVLTFNTQPQVIDSLLLSKYNEFSGTTLLLYGVLYFVGAVASYGLTIPSGLFTPSIIFGSVMGRLYAHCLVHLGVEHTDPGLYALLGAAAFLGGGLRFTAAIAVLLLEVTESEQQLPFIIMTLVIAKGIADRFNASIIEEAMKIKNLTFLNDTLPRCTRTLALADVMTDDASVLPHLAPAKAIRDLLERSHFHEFPVNYCSCPPAPPRPSPEITASAVASASGSVPMRTRVGFADSPTREYQLPPHAAATGGFLGVVKRETLEGLVKEMPCEALIDLRPFAQPSMAVPVDAPFTSSYDMYLRIMNSTGTQQVPVVESYGRAIGTMDRRRLTYLELKAAHERQLAAQEPNPAMWSMRSSDMTLLLSEMDRGYLAPRRRSWTWAWLSETNPWSSGIRHQEPTAPLLVGHHRGA